MLKSPISSILSYFSLYNVSALVTSEIKISGLEDGVLNKPKMSHFLFVNASSRGSISILNENCTY